MSAEQGTPEWLKERCGHLTASVFVDVMSEGRKAGRKNLIAKLVAERLTGEPGESFTNAAMQWGTENEAIARSAYELKQGVLVSEVGFIKHDYIFWAGASPDGLVGDKGLVEIKCPNTATHIEYFTTRTPPENYTLQMQWQMACTNRLWCDLVSFDPRLPPEYQMMVVRVERDDIKIKKMEDAAEKFLQEVSDTIAKLKSVAREHNPVYLAEQA